MRFTIDLTKNSDLTEFNRLILANEGSQESTYELFLEDIRLLIEVSGLLSTKPQRIAINLAKYSIPYGGYTFICPLSDLRYKHLELFKFIFVQPDARIGYLTYKTTHEIIKGVEVIVNLLKRNHKLKAFI